MFLRSLNDLEIKNKEKYKFIINGGPKLKQAIFKLFNVVWTTEKKPEQWRKTKIVQIYKGKGSIHEFQNQRNIHTKGEIPKLFGHIILNEIKATLLENMSIYQIGTKSGHRAQEHLFALKSIVSLHLSKDQPIIIQLYDVAKFFDCESLRDGLDALYNCGITGNLYRLIYLLNKDTKITVKTCLGESKEADTGENIGQGTVEGAVISAASIDYTIAKFFDDSEAEISYGNLNLRPLIFQDDIARLSTSVNDAQVGNIKLSSCMESKLLDFNVDSVGSWYSEAKSLKEKLKVNSFNLHLH